MRDAPPTRAELRWNALLALLLVAAVVVLGNRLARRHLALRFDLSEDRLYALAPQTRAILGRLEDPLQVTAYFTGDIKSGELRLAKARLEGQLAELAELAGGRMQVEIVDPEASTEALVEAQELGVVPYAARTRQGVVEVRQEVFLGLLLRYRGREEVIPFALPQDLEAQVVMRVHALLREERRVVGWTGDVAGARERGEGAFTRALAALARQHELVEVRGLESGAPVPAEVDLLLVLRPQELHPRVAFEIDQFVQRGGRLLACVEHVRMSKTRGSGTLVEKTGLEPLLAAWGARVARQHVWSDDHGALMVTRTLPIDGRATPTSLEIAYPPFVRARGAGLARELPPTAGLQSVVFYWAQPIAPDPPPEGVERATLVASGPDSWLVPLQLSIEVDEDVLRAQSEAAWARGAGARFPLAVALSGRFPSPFAAGAPAPFDAFAGDGDAAATGESVRSAEQPSQVVVFGDADWLRDDFGAEGLRLFANVVDWLLQGDELVALRSRVPRERPLADFLAEELRERGLEALEATTSLEQADRRMRAESEARAAARRRQWVAMLAPLGATLALVFGLGLAWKLAGRRGAAS